MGPHQSTGNIRVSWADFCLDFWAQTGASAPVFRQFHGPPQRHLQNFLGSCLGRPSCASIIFRLLHGPTQSTGNIFWPVSWAHTTSPAGNWPRHVASAFAGAHGAAQKLVPVLQYWPRQPPKKFCWLLSVGPWSSPKNSAGDTVCVACT